MMKSAGLDTEGVTIFIGRDVSKSIEANMRLFSTVIVPLVRYAQEHGVTLFVENCPMCGWSTEHELFVQNIANCPLHWILMDKILESAGLSGWMKINYDPSHDILQRTRPEWTFEILAQTGFTHMIGRFHGKDLSAQIGKLAFCGSMGERFGNPWNKMVGDQPLPGATRYDPQAIARGNQVDWFNMLVKARNVLGLEMDEITFTTEFEQSEFRQRSQFNNPEHHWNVAGKLVVASIGFIQGLDQAAAQHVYMEALVSGGGTWSWQPDETTDAEFMVGTEEIMERAEAWTFPKPSPTSDLVISD
jgi:hypothetical protein